MTVENWELWSDCESDCSAIWQKQNNTNLICAAVAHERNNMCSTLGSDFTQEWCELMLPHYQMLLSVIYIKHFAHQHTHIGNSFYCDKDEFSEGQRGRCAVEGFQWIDGWCEQVSSKVTLIVCLSPEPGKQDQLRRCRSCWPDRFSTASTRAVTFSDIDYMASWFAVASQFSLRLHTCSASIGVSTS